MIRIALALLIAVTLHGTSLGQVPIGSTVQTQDTAPDTLQTPTPPAPIPATQIAPQAEEVAQRLLAIRPRIAPDPGVIDLARELPGLSSEIEQLLEDPAVRNPESLSLRRLEDSRQRWSGLGVQLDEWQNTVGARSGLLAAELDSLRTIRGTWRETAETAEENALPPAAVAQVNSVLEAIADVDRQLTARLQAILSLQNTIAERQIQVNEVLAGIDAATQLARLNLLTPSDPPLWRAIVWTGLSTGQLGESLRQDWLAVSRFADENSQRLIGMAAVFLLLLALMASLPRRARAWSEQDPDVEAAALVLGRPVAATLLIVLIGLRIFFPDPPPALVDLNRLLLLFAVLRLVPRLLGPALRRPLYGLALLFLLQLLTDFLPEGSFFQRLYLLIVTGLALTGVIWELRPGGIRDRESARRGWRRGVVLGLRISLMVFAISLVANVLGFVSLADLLTRATLTSAFLAFVLFAGTQVVVAVVRLLLRTRAARSLNAVRTHSDLLIQRAIILLNLLAVLLWVVGTFFVFSLLGPVLEVLSAILNTPLSVGALSIALGDIGIFGVAVWLAVTISRLVRFMLQEDVLPRLTLPRGVPGAISQLAHYVILAFGLLFAFAAAGIDLSRLALLVGALGVGIGFGLQNIVNNFVSGLILIFERPIKVGDTIELDPLLGTVKHIGIRASTVRTLEGAEVIVPNGDLIASKVVNWTLSDRQRRVDVPVGVAYGTDPDRVVDILVGVARDLPDVLAQPEPVALFRGFGDSSLDFVLRVWTPEFERWMRVQSDVARAVHHALRDAGITIPFPQRDLHVRSVDPAIAGGLGAKTTTNDTGPSPARPKPDPDA